MPPVYVREQGAIIRRRGERLIVVRDGKTLLDLPLIHLDQLVLFGNVQLTAPAVAMLLQAEVDVVFFEDIDHVSFGPRGKPSGSSPAM
ncbi:MAG TPA: hypothetical protein ENK56_01005, partial [Chloroflexi bacterium]|nr:hypothetical protein [Chloroflexota bacterium]